MFYFSQIASFNAVGRFRESTKTAGYTFLRFTCYNHSMKDGTRSILSFALKVVSLLCLTRKSQNPRAPGKYSTRLFRLETISIPLAGRFLIRFFGFSCFHLLIFIRYKEGPKRFFGIRDFPY